MAEPTKLGFPGGASDSPAPWGTRPAGRTLFGRAPHLRPSASPWTPAAPRREAPAGQPPDRLPSSEIPDHSGKSLLPAIAGFFGRWRQGELVDDLEDGDSLAIPRHHHLRSAAIVAIATLVSFLAVRALVSSPEPPPASPVAAPAAAVPQPPPTAAAAENPGPTAKPVPATKRRSTRAPKPSVRSKRRAGPDPDAPLPLGF